MRTDMLRPIATLLVVVLVAVVLAGRSRPRVVVTVCPEMDLIRALSVDEAPRAAGRVQPTERDVALAAVQAALRASTDDLWTQRAALEACEEDRRGLIQACPSRQVWVEYHRDRLRGGN